MIDKNGEEEWRLAKELGQVVKDSEGNDTDIMYTTIIGDAGWGKRSYKGHGMNSPAGVVSAVQFIFALVKSKFKKPRMRFFLTG